MNFKPKTCHSEESLDFIVKVKYNIDAGLSGLVAYVTGNKRVIDRENDIAPIIFHSSEFD